MKAIKYDEGKPKLSLLSQDMLQLLIPHSTPYELRNVVKRISSAAHSKGHAECISYITLAISELREYLGPKYCIEQCTRGLEYGLVKYCRNNWKLGMEWSRVLDAALRHLVFGPCLGEQIDESGNTHYAHALCMLMFAYEYIDKELGVNDLFQAEIDLTGIWEEEEDNV